MLWLDVACSDVNVETACAVDLGSDLVEGLANLFDLLESVLACKDWGNDFKTTVACATSNACIVNDLPVGHNLVCVSVVASVDAVVAECFFEG